jgi:hypothetical protein
MMSASVGIGDKDQTPGDLGRCALDGFCSAVLSLTPERLDIGLRSNETGGTRVVEIIPSFQDAPSNWLDVFDARGSVPDLYNIPSRDGIVQVLLSPHVKTVLENIKRLHGRRVAGARAEAFLINPYAALGEAASETIEEAQFLNARAEAGLLFGPYRARCAWLSHHNCFANRSVDGGQ